MITGKGPAANVLKRADRTASFTAFFPLLKGRGPGQLVLQYTDACNARCPQCSMRVTELFRRSKLDRDSAKRIIDAAAQRGVKALSFTGGEPLLYLDEIVDLLKHAKAAGIKFTRTGTNGYLFANPDRPDYLNRVTETVEKLAESGLYTFWISIDSAEPGVHEQMRGLPGVIDGIEMALPIFHSHGMYPSANLGINKKIGGLSQPPLSAPEELYAFYRTAFRKFYNLVVDLGFTIANVCYPMSIEENDGSGLQAVYGATAAGGITHYTPAEKELVFKALFHTIPEFRHRIRIFSPRSSLFSLMRQHRGGDHTGHPCRGGTDYFFIDARDGNTYPCGYRGNENLGKFWELGPAQIDHRPSCKKCDWECFRDPSEMIGPLISLFTSPHLFYSKILRDEQFRKLWLEDLKYYWACDFFDCSKAPDLEKLASFGCQQEVPIG
ncbi:MAG TPA: radical SAM protein [Nitrospirota bacterium]|nr:radical SAM protein [Nitrospirota bacterium]